MNAVETLLLIAVLVVSALLSMGLSHSLLGQGEGGPSAEDLLRLKGLLERRRPVSLPGGAALELRNMEVLLCVPKGCIRLNLTSTCIRWETEGGFRLDADLSREGLWHVSGNSTLVGLCSGLAVSQRDDTVIIEFVRGEGHVGGRIVQLERTVAAYSFASTHASIRAGGRVLLEWRGYRKILVNEITLKS